MHVVVLGSGGSWPSRFRNVPAVAVKRGAEVILLDCGEGTQRQFMLSPLSFMDVTKILITHFHADHFLGIPGLLQSMGFNNRERAVSIYGPRGTKRLVQDLISLGYFKAGYQIDAVEMEGGDAIDCGEYSIRAMDARHVVPGIMYSIEEKERPGRFNLQRAQELGIPEGRLYQRLQSGETIEHRGSKFTPDMVLGPPRRGRKLVYTGDTEPFDELVDFARDCDLLIHDGTVDSTLEAKANEYGHSSARQAAQIAKRCNAGRLLLVHISPRYEEPEKIEKDAKEVFENSIVAKDFLEMDIPLPE